MTNKHRQYILRKLWRRCDGKCQSCRRFTAIIHVVQGLEGWILVGDPSTAREVISPKGYILPVATIEHLIPRAKGGGDEEKNLTLYCLDCNKKTAHWGLTPQLAEAA